MGLKDIIKNTTDTQSTNKFESVILSENTKKIKIKITEKQLKRLEEDLRYWRVDDADPNNDEYKLGV